MQELRAGGTGVIARDPEEHSNATGDDARATNWLGLIALAKRQMTTNPLPDRTNEAWHYGDPRKFVAADLPLDPVASGFEGPGSPEFYSSGPAGLVDADYLYAQHFALSSTPHFLHLKRNEARGEIHLRCPGPASGMAGVATLFIRADMGSSAKVFLHLEGENNAERSLHSVMVFAELADGAQVVLNRVQNYGARADALVREFAGIGSNATYTSNLVQLGGNNIRAEAHALLNGQGATAFLRGAYLATGRQRFDFLTHQNHQAPHATSNLLYKGALLGRARASYQGMITVAPDAQRTDAYQSNRTLVLSGDARADSSPQLEIGANDVRCTHGSTVSNVSETELFYMQSRGIPREVARRLLVSAFIAEVTDQVGSQGVSDLVEKYVAELNA